MFGFVFGGGGGLLPLKYPRKNPDKRCFKALFAFENSQLDYQSFLLLLNIFPISFRTSSVNC